MTAITEVRRTRFASLEYGRGAAALAVLLFHTEDTSYRELGVVSVQNIFLWGHLGVDFFFVLSGFIMVLIHFGDFGRPGMVSLFLTRRAVRVLPMLWTVLFGLAVGHLLAPHLVRTPHSVEGFVADVLLAPYPGNLTLIPIWTLKRELLFYLLFAGAIVRPKAGLSVLAVWQVFCLANAGLGFAPGFYGQFLFDGHNLGFGAGGLAAYLHLRRPCRSMTSWLCCALGVLVLASTASVEWSLGHSLPSEAANPIGDQLEAVLGVVGATLLVIGMIGLERSKRSHLSRWASLAGGTSYVLYLIHEPIVSGLVRSIAAPAIRMGMAVDMVFLLIVAVTVAGACMIHLAYERPLLGWLAKATRRAGRRVQAVM